MLTQLHISRVLLLRLPVEWQPSTPSTTLHSCAGLHCQGSQVTLLLPAHLQRCEQSFSVNQVSPTYIHARGHPHTHKRKCLMRIQGYFFFIHNSRKSENRSHLPAGSSRLRLCIHTRWVGRICLHWGWGRGCKRTPPHRAGCKSRRGLQGPDSWAGGRRSHTGCNDCPRGTSELEGGGRLEKQS